MSNRLIDKYKKEVKLIEAVLRGVNITQSERVHRIYDNAFKKGVLSDQDFFESVNWYAKKVINIATRNSLMASRKYEFEKIRFWNSVVIAITPLLGDHPSFTLDEMIRPLALECMFPHRPEQPHSPEK